MQSIGRRRGSRDKGGVTAMNQTNPLAIASVSGRQRAEAALATLAGVAAERGAGPRSAEAHEERSRLAAARFFVACVGQFKRGKSTLLNALARRPVLPVGVGP